MEEILIINCLWILVTALVWGITNPFLRKGAKGIDVVGESDSKVNDGGDEEKKSLLKVFKTAFKEAKWCLLNWKLTLPFAVNQSGSVLFYYWLVALLFFYSANHFNRFFACLRWL